MQLKEEFENSDILISREKRVLNQIKIADKHAIDFIEWTIRTKTYNTGLDAKQLLTMYKNAKKI